MSSKILSGKTRKKNIVLSMGSQAVLDFCRARQLLKDEKDKRKDILDETADAKRVTLDLLKDSMIKHSLLCLPLPAQDGETRYARLVAAPNRYPTMRTFADVQRFACNMKQEVVNVATLDVPMVAARVFLDRAKISSEERRVVIQSKLPKKLLSVTASPPAEPYRLGQSVDAAVKEYKDCRTVVRSLGASVREASKVAEHVIQNPVTLEMNKDGRRKIIRVSKETKTVKTKASIGIRQLSSYVKEAAAHAVNDWDNFDQLFAERLRQLVEQHDPVDARARLKVSERSIR